jgi:hypothetical protein
MGIVDLEGITPASFARIRWRSEVLTVNFIVISLVARIKGVRGIVKSTKGKENPYNIPICKEKKKKIILFIIVCIGL